MHVYNLVVFLCCAVATVGLTEGRLRRTRRGACEYGTYQHEGNTCCLCPTGYQVLNHCTDKPETHCERCEDGAYMDHPNSDHKCQPCKVCDSNANMDTKERCSPFYNTVCWCKENYYCDKRDQCKACSPCDMCEKLGVKQQCTKTNNTVCHDAIHPQSTSTGTIVAVSVLLILLAGVGVLVFWLWRKHKLCFKDEQSKDAINHEEGLHLKDLELNPDLAEIADVLGWKTMKRVAQRSGVSKTDIEEHELNHHNDVKEQTFALLQAWSQRQGLHGAYPALIKNLRHMNEIRTADEIQKIIEKEAIAQP
ncbi:tumor necrosis factor receptor superfamily member 6 [Sinocyclocheilus grahami]|uniref:Tumor necrosis factor receptor superfamily member 6 n=1 Tax=Sinocyclocheilus grahami TaxID=75366 RepID=A0A672K4Z9_SINGR|nr:PREDICTED: tumor necrosis factor receptor superfamily member 6-like [Sinocyclocheilus grahami]XP_016125297.1 PREDICTED: tumor necrosis factor receptor superfamily member 6-like [Sinocyclocheilus grahami]